ncbi:myocardial zonula adherens protein isoform X1 [Bufo bufo]|uniref:myocardial zonula adherens protein isoform X1 n=1 Tax=Bufo bufo TaxID=8384 RepID=UPI001ABEA7A8|nr:myocardial zonula adherens protein isoform X1 [Bufo bufo]
MMRYKTASTVTTTSETSQKSGNICRLRLTLPVDGASKTEQKDFNKEKQSHVDSRRTTDRRKRNGFILRANPSELPTLHLYSVPKGTQPPGTASHGVVYGVVQRTENNHQNEVVVYEWSSHQLKEEMNYIKDVRVTLEKIRERMFGEYDDMKEKIKRLSQEMKVSSAQQELWRTIPRHKASAIDSLGDINSSLNASSIEIQKTLVDMTLENCNIKDEVKNLKHSYNDSLDKLKEKQCLLEVAQAENQLLRVKIESSQEANAEVMREMTRKLYSQYEQKIQEEEKKYVTEREAMIAQAKQYIKAIEDASEKVTIAEAKIEERDLKIVELDQLVQRMHQEREQLQVQLTRHEERIHRLDQKMDITTSERARTQNLEEAATSLRERIKHLDDMVHCQQKKVKHMIEEIELLKKKVHYKDLLIQQLLERIAMLEGENNELQDKMEYLMANQPKEAPETKDASTSCEPPQMETVQPQQPRIVLSITQSSKKLYNYDPEVGSDPSNSPASINTTESDDCQGNGIEPDSKRPPQRSYTPYMRVLELSMKNKVS